MANPENLKPVSWKPGQSGNPAGYSRGRRIADAVEKTLERLAADSDVGLAIVALATGRHKLLKDVEEDEGKRSPSLEWMAFLRETLGQVESRVTSDESDSDSEPKADPEADAWAVYRAQELRQEQVCKAESSLSGGDCIEGEMEACPPPDPPESVPP